MSRYTMPVRDRLTRAEKRANYLGLNIVANVGRWMIDRDLTNHFRIYTNRGHLACLERFETLGAAVAKAETFPGAKVNA